MNFSIKKKRKKDIISKSLERDKRMGMTNEDRKALSEKRKVDEVFDLPMKSIKNKKNANVFNSAFGGDIFKEKTLECDQFILFCSEHRLFTKEKVNDFLGINFGDSIVYHFMEKRDKINNKYMEIQGRIYNIKCKSTFWKNKWISVLDVMKKNFKEIDPLNLSEEICYKLILQYNLMDYETSSAELNDDMNQIHTDSFKEKYIGVEENEIDKQANKELDDKIANSSATLNKRRQTIQLSKRSNIVNPTSPKRSSKNENNKNIQFKIASPLKNNKKSPKKSNKVEDNKHTHLKIASPLRKKTISSEKEKTGKSVKFIAPITDVSNSTPGLKRNAPTPNIDLNIDIPAHFGRKKDILNLEVGRLVSKRPSIIVDYKTLNSQRNSLKHNDFNESLSNNINMNFDENSNESNSEESQEIDERKKPFTRRQSVSIIEPKDQQSSRKYDEPKKSSFKRLAPECDEPRKSALKKKSAFQDETK